ncbi:UNVERIFIED_CONTAM: hypothetical protein FKN15_021147 [Acipenser sinensis]
MAVAMAEQQPPQDVDADECLSSYSYIYSPDLLKDKVAFITGGGSGIGFRIAEVLMRHGCDTVIGSRNQDRLAEAAKKLTTATGRHCLPLSLDVRQPQTIAAAVEETLREFGRIDILINNAAGNFLCPASALSFNAFKTVMEIDTMGTFNTSKVIYEKWLKVIVLFFLRRDKVAFITGGGSGIGFRIAEVLMRHGCDTVIGSRNQDRLAEAAKKLTTATGRHCLPLSLDVRQPQTIAAAVEETLREFGRIDILINNAAGNFLCPASALSFNAFKTVMEIDTMGTFNTSKVIYEKWLKVQELPTQCIAAAVPFHMVLYRNTASHLQSTAVHLCCY